MKFASRALVRAVLHSRTGGEVSHRDILIERKTDDTPPKMLKPVWVVPQALNPSWLHFNISDDANVVVLARHDRYLIGIDLMEVKVRMNQTMEDFFSGVDIVFLPEEWHWVRAPRQDSAKLLRFMMP